MAVAHLVKRIGETGEVAFEPDKWDASEPDARGTVTYTPKTGVPAATVQVLRPPLPAQDHVACKPGTKVAVTEGGVVRLEIHT